MYLLPAHPFMDAGNVITFRALEANGHTLLFVDHSDVDHLISLKGLRNDFFDPLDLAIANVSVGANEDVVFFAC